MFLSTFILCGGINGGLGGPFIIGGPPIPGFNGPPGNCGNFGGGGKLVAISCSNLKNYDQTNLKVPKKYYLVTGNTGDSTTTKITYLPKMCAYLSDNNPSQ